MIRVQLLETCYTDVAPGWLGNILASLDLLPGLDYIPAPGDTRITVATVVHPYTWLQRLYRVNPSHSWARARATADTFPEFVANYVRHAPGFYGSLLPRADIYMRSEDQPTALSSFLRSLDVTWRPAAVAVSWPDPLSPLYHDVMAVERDACCLFNYY